MPTTASDSRRALSLVSSTAAAEAVALVGSLPASPDSARAVLLEAVPALVSYYSDGSSALAADFYDDQRDAAGARGRFLAEPVVVDRAEKVARAVVWAAQPLFVPELGETVASRLEGVVQLEVARPYRDTITANTRRDPASVGWRRIASGTGCKFCRMLADRGAVFKQDTARFASHGHCHCSAAPVFDGQDGQEASALQYVASEKRRSEKDQARLREYLNRHYADAHG